MTFKQYNSNKEMKQDMIKEYKKERDSIDNADFPSKEEKERLKWLNNEIKRLEEMKL